MPISKHGQNSLLGLVGSDSEDSTAEVMGKMSSEAEDPAPRRTRGRPRSTTTKVTKTRSTACRANVTKVAPPKRGKRPPLSDMTNEQNSSNNTEKAAELDHAGVEVDGHPSKDELDISVVVVEPRQPAAKKKTGRKGKGSTEEIPKHADVSSQVTDEPNADVRRLNVNLDKHDEVILETQVSMIGGQYVEEKAEGSASKPIANSRIIAPSGSSSLQTRKRTRSTSDTEGNEPALRRKLGDLTKQLDNLQVKYRTVREIGIKEAERNFERLKKQNEENTMASNALIASLKADLSAQNIQMNLSEKLRKTTETQAAELSQLQAKVAQLTSSLSEAQRENKSLSTKLAASRTMASSLESTNGWPPSSAVKPNRNVVMKGSAEVAQAAQIAQLKEDIYSDLTGLIILGVKREADEDVYDCIQTGRNGTLHFKLAVANEKTAESYDDAHCIYVPQLDPNRDKALMEVLPEYLVEEITFPRPHAAKFYARVTKALTEKQD